MATPLPYTPNPNRNLVARARETLVPALQPIVDIGSGRTLAVEALVRNYGALGFDRPERLFALAHQEGVLPDLDALLIGKAIEAYASSPIRRSALLFINLDGRLLTSWQHVRDTLVELVSTTGLDPWDICIELSEAYQPLPEQAFDRAVQGLRAPGFMIAIDDFGTGNSGLQMLYQSNPDFIKVDRFFIRQIPSDAKKRLMVGTMVELAHTMGARVIAEGIETAGELASCRDVHCDMVQGYLVEHPVAEAGLLKSHYPVAAQAPSASATSSLPKVPAAALRPVTPPGPSTDRPETQMAAPGAEPAGAVDPAQQQSIRELLLEPPIFSMDDRMADALEVFARHERQPFFPVIDARGIPRGAIFETDIKPILYSRFGRDLASNALIRLSVTKYLRPAPVLEIRTPLGPRLDLIAESAGEGVLVTEATRYIGYLPSSALIMLSNNLRLREASDQNPLTGLPGNDAINRTIARLLTEDAVERLMVYVDISNFKPFNDRYGFETGDKALSLMGRLLSELGQETGAFVGHIGGDDFFVAAEGGSCRSTEVALARLGEAFAGAAVPLHWPDDQAAGYLEGRGRDGITRRFPLLSCTAAALKFARGDPPLTSEQSTALLANIKDRARRSGLVLLIEPAAGQSFG